MTKIIPHLDGWRGLAILLVLQSHFGFGGGGRLGVALFFALSGYLMGELLFVKNVPLTSFFMRRISRIMPTFWLYLIAAAGFALWYQPQPYIVPVYEWVSTLLFSRTYFPVADNLWLNEWPIGHFWSLNVEEHSYIYLAILALVSRGVKGAWLPWMLVASIAACLLFIFYYMLSPPNAASPWFARSECAALGLIASATLRVIRHQTSRAGIREGAIWVTPVTLVLAAICCSWSAYPILSITLSPLLLAVALNYLDRSPALFRNALSLPILRWFGICSFSLYVWQQLFYVAYQNGALSRQVAGILAIMVGASMFYLFENPARLYLNQYITRKAKARTGQVAPNKTMVGQLDLTEIEAAEPERLSPK